MMFQPRIAISGAGPGGLALARLLSLRGFNPVLYDLREKPAQSDRYQPAGMLDLHADTGLAAIKACGLEAEFQTRLGDCSEAVRIFNTQAQPLYNSEDESGRPEISRTSLVDLLLHGQTTPVQWSTKILGITPPNREPDPSSKISLQLAQGMEESADLVVGADGAWSRVRRLLTDVKPTYTGIQYLTITARHVSSRFPNTLKMTGTGSFFVTAGGDLGGAGMITQRGPQDSIRMYIAIRTPHVDWKASVNREEAPASGLKDVLLDDTRYFGSWDPSLKDVIATICDEDSSDNGSAPADIRPIYTLPEGTRWTNNPAVTLLGDAAHLMAPNGEGVNLALADALDLADCIVQASQSSAGSSATNTAQWQQALQPYLREYEQRMIVRADVAFKDTVELLDTMFGASGGSEALTAMFQSFDGQQPEKLYHPNA
ncbi:hypothetical protein IAU60_006885 [Kwoniella sp. DSM 27419]